MGNANYKHNQDIILYFINDSIVTYTNPICSICAFKLFDAVWSRIDFKTLNPTKYRRDLGLAYFSEILFRRPGKLNPIGGHLRQDFV